MTNDYCIRKYLAMTNGVILCFPCSVLKHLVKSCIKNINNSSKIKFDF